MADLQIPVDPRLDRQRSFDPRSRQFTVRAFLDAQAEKTRLRGRTWSPGRGLDQGQEGACVGFACTHRRNGRPRSFNFDDIEAHEIYQRAQQLDEWPGENYQGTSVLAGMKAGTERGWWSEYRWVGAGSQTPLEDALDAMDDIGPVIFGLDWLDTMMEPRPSGLLDCTGTVIGGHAICGIGYRMRARLKGEGSKPLEVAVLQQSWGLGHGVAAYGQTGGFVFMRLTDLEMLLNRQGEGAVPIETA